MFAPNESVGRSCVEKLFQIEGEFANLPVLLSSCVAAPSVLLPALFLEHDSVANELIELTAEFPQVWRRGWTAVARKSLISSIPCSWVVGDASVVFEAGVCDVNVRNRCVQLAELVCAENSDAGRLLIMFTC